MRGTIRKGHFFKGTRLARAFFLKGQGSKVLKMFLKARVRKGKAFFGKGLAQKA